MQKFRINGCGISTPGAGQSLPPAITSSMFSDVLALAFMTATLCANCAAARWTHTSSIVIVAIEPVQLEATTQWCASLSEA